MDTKQFRLSSSLVSVMECPIGTMFKDHLFPVPSIHHPKSPGIHGNGLYIQAHLLQINSTHPFHFLNANKQVVLTTEFPSSFLSVFSMWTACHVSTYITISLSGFPPFFPSTRHWAPSSDPTKSLLSTCSFRQENKLWKVWLNLLLRQSSAKSVNFRFLSDYVKETLLNIPRYCL